MMFLFQVGAQKLASDDALRQTQVAFQKFSSMVSQPKSDPVKTVSPALVPLLLFESNSDSSKSVKDAFSKGDLGGIKVTGVFSKYRDYLESVKVKIDGKLYDETMRILDKIAPAKQQEAPDAKKSDYYQKTQSIGSSKTRGISSEEATASDALSIEKQIFNSFVQGKAPSDELSARLKTALNDDVKYANFLSILRGGVVGGKFFTSNWENFKTLVQLVDSSSSTRSRAATVFECGTKEEAGAFNTALSQIKCIKLTKAYVEHVNAQLNDPRYAPAIFTYVEPETQEKPLAAPQAPATVSSTEGALSRANVYRMVSEVNYKILPGKVDVMPEASQITLSSKSKPFDINYNASQQVLYARHFDPKDSESLKLVSQLAGEQLRLFLADKDLTLKGGEIFAKDGRKYSKDEKLNLLKDMKIEGSATLESPEQWQKNRDLALARGKMLGEAIIGMMFEGDIPAVKGAKQKERDASQKKRDAEVESYVAKFNNGKGIEASVVSPWSPDSVKSSQAMDKDEAREVLNSIMASIKSGGDAYAKEICDAEDKKYNFNTPQFLLSLMTGKDGYKDARALLGNSTFPKKEKDQLLRLVTLAEKTSGGKPAVTYDEKTGQHSFTNEPLAQKLWLTQDGANIGLRYESAKEVNGKLVVSPPKTAKERLGAFFVSSLEDGYTRSASLLRSSKGQLSIDLLNYHEKDGPELNFTSTSQVVAGKTYYATLSVAYKVGEKNEIFNGKVYAEVNNKGNVYAWANNKDTEARLVKVNDDNTCIYELKFTPKAGEENRIDAVAYKFLGDKRVSSGFVAAPLNLAKEIVTPQPEPQKTASTPGVFYAPEVPVVPHAVSVTEITIPAFGSALARFGGTILNQNIEAQLKDVFGSVTQDPFGAYKTGNASFKQLLALQEGIPTAFSDWMNDPRIKPSLQAQLGSNYDNFAKAIAAGNYTAAGNLLGGEAAKAFNTFQGALTNIQQANALNAIITAVNGSANPFIKVTGSVKLMSPTENSRIDLNVYYNAQSNSLEISDQGLQAYSVKNAGAQLVLSMPNVRLKMGGGEAFISNSLLPKSKNVDGFSIDQYYARVGGDAYVRLSELVTAGLQLGYTKVFAKSGVQLSGPVSVSLLGADLVNAYVGLTFEPGNLTSILQGVTINAGLISQVAVNNENIGRQARDNIRYSFGLGVNIGKVLRVPFLENGILYVTPIVGAGVKPSVQFGLKLNID